MSVLSFPRIILNGEIDWNPATTNNTLGVGYDKDAANKVREANA